MNNKNAKTAKLLTKIGSFLCMFMAVFLLVISMITPVEITINGSYTRATLQELTEYPGPLTFWLSIIVVLFILGIVGLLISRRVQKQATTAQGFILIIMGFPTMAAAGAGILFMIAGVQTFLAKKVQDLTA